MQLIIPLECDNLSPTMYCHIQVTGYRDLRMVIFDFGIGYNGFRIYMFSYTIKKYFFKHANSDSTW